MRNSYPDMLVHGVGSSCGGNQYHHVVHHLVRNEQTLCGVAVRGTDWWNGGAFSYRAFENTEPVSIGFDTETRCTKCAKAYAKEIREEYNER